MQSLNTQTSPQICSNCGQSFICDIQAGQERCWCMDFPILNQGEINSHQSCLCPDCLNKALSKSHPKGETY